MVFTTQDGKRAWRQHLLGCRPRAVDHNPLHGRFLLGQIHALTLEATNLPRHGQGAGGCGCVKRDGPDAINRRSSVRLAGKQDIDLTVKVGHRGRFGEHETTRNFHRRQGRNSGTVAEEGPAG